jgi:citrate lyase subunit beta / citryl-CoA lyase
MRSLLFVPADSERKLAKAPSCGADVLVLDLEDSISAENKSTARQRAAEFVKANRGTGPQLHIRINGFSSGEVEADLDAVVPAGPDAIMLPKSESGNDISLLSAMIAPREATAGIDDGAIGILPIATETAGAIFHFSTYKDASARLVGLAWSSEDLSAALGVETYLDANGAFTDPFRLARSLCLFGAANAGVAAVDRVFPNFRDAKAFESEALAARRDGFTAKLVIHPDQVAIVNEVFTPSADSIAHARAVIAAFDAEPGAGVVALDGEMLDVPHLAKAKALLARAKAAGKLDP